MRRVLVTCLGLEVETGLAREGGDQSSHHGRQQCQEGRVGEVLPAVPGLPERRLVGEGTQRVDVGEEVVDEGVHGRKRAYGLGGELCWVRRLQLGQRMGSIGGRLRRRGARVRVAVGQPSLLDGLGMAVGGPAAATGAFKGAGDLESHAGATRRASFIALYLADAARVAGLAQAVGLGRL